jgi:hypothetical protein
VAAHEPARRGPTPFDMVASIVALFALGVAQPFLELLGRNAEFFVAHDLSGGNVVLFAMGLLLLIPLTIAGVVLVVRRFSAGAGARLHLVVISGCVAIYASHLLRSTVAWPGTLSLAALIGLFIAWLYQRSSRLRAVCRFGVVLPVVLGGLFLLASPASGLVRDGSRGTTVALSAGEPIPVVLVIFDEFPLSHLMTLRGGIDGHLFPHFAQLARGSTWFRNATTVHPSTNRAVPAILSGQVPDPPRLPVLKEFPRNLFTMLGRSHKVVAAEQITALCPPRLCAASSASVDERAGWRDTITDLRLVGLHLFLPRGLTRSLPAIDQSWADFAGAKDAEAAKAPASPNRKSLRQASKGGRPDWIRSFIRSMKPSKRPPLYMLHAMFPHPPFQYLPDGTLYTTTSTSLPLNGTIWRGDPWAVLNTYQRGLVQAQFTDRLLGDLVNKLHDIDLWDDAMVIVVSDHGASFTPGTQRRIVQSETVGEVAPVPLFIKLPHQRSGRIDDRPAVTIDIMPTIASVLDVDWAFPGFSLFGPPPPPDRRREILLDGGRRFPLHPDGSDKLAFVKRKYELFPHDGDSIDLYGIGPHPELLGRAPTSAGRDQHHWSLDDESTSELARATTIPAFLAGEVDAEGIDVAIAVDGKIRAVTRSFAVDDRIVFRVLVRPDLRAAGDKRIEVFRITARGRLLKMERS